MNPTTPSKTAMVTGATGAIGAAICRQIARDKNYHVIMVCRNPEKAKKVCDEIIASTNNPNVSFEIADLSRRSEIRNLASRVRLPLDVLVNNAAATPVRREETPEGIEMQFAANVLNYFWMSLAFLGHLEKAAPSRIVNVASFWAGDLDLDDLEFKKRRYDNNTAYRQSKQANRMLTVAFAEKFKAARISVNACHPGEVNSSLSNSLGFGGHHSPDQGAYTPVWLATSDEGLNKTGKWFADRREQPCGFARDLKGIERLYDVCQSYTRDL